MGGAGVALPSDATNAATNPALMARLGTELMISPAWFHPVRTMDVRGPGIPAFGGAPVANITGKQTSLMENYVEGSAGYNRVLTPEWSVGISIYGSGGMQTKYRNSRINPAFQTPKPGLPVGYDTQVRYRLAHFAPTLSYKPNNWSAYGVSAIVGYADFKTNMATLPAFRRAEGDLDLDYAVGGGVRIGGLWDIGKMFTFGASATSPVWFSMFHEFKDLFIGPINTPANATVGVVWHATPSTEVAFDVKHVVWKSVNAIRQAPREGGFGWDNQTIFLVGVQQRLTDNFTVRAGYNYGKSPIADDKVFANALFPAITDHHVTAGATYKFSQRFELTGSAFYAFKAEQTDPGNPAEQFSAFGAGTKVDMYQYGLQAGFKFKF